jgi:hypothetical protein
MEPTDPNAVTTLPEFVDYLDALSRHFEREKGGADWQHRDDRCLSGRDRSLASRDPE